ncbi:hypothetical protein [Geopseudomonas aromaticivorans]
MATQFRKVPFVLAITLLAGCATKKPVEDLRNDPSMAKLAAAAQLAQQDLARLSSAENAIAESKRTELDRQREARARSAVVPGFERTTNEVFTLPYPKAIDRVATLAGYKFFPSMTLPSNPQMVSVEGKGQTLQEVMAKISDQMPSDVSVHVYAAKKVVVLSPRN